MLKLTMCVKENIDISKFKQLNSFLKRKNDGYIPKKASLFSKNEVDEFLGSAPDETSLMWKAAMILGISGAMRTDELYNLKFEDVQLNSDVAIVQIVQSKNKLPRRFVVTSTNDEINWFKIIKKYMELRPKGMKENRFFVRYIKGKCVRQVVGKHTLADIPHKIAKLLKLDNVNEYTGHTFRRTSATLLADGGADILALKRHGGWKSSTVAEGYVGDSLNNKIDTANRISYGVPQILEQYGESENIEKDQESENVGNNPPKVDNFLEKSITISQNVANSDYKNIFNPPSINIENCSNCNINITFNK